MAVTKSDIAKKIADDCGFMKGEATEVFEKLLDIIKTSLIAGEGVYDLRLREMERQIQARSKGQEP